MEITARFMCPELVGAVKSGLYEVPEGINPVELLRHVRQQFGLEDADVSDQLLFLRNGQPASAETVLQNGDQVFFLRKIYGG